jgi:hypothetical protein
METMPKLRNENGKGAKHAGMARAKYIHKLNAKREERK